MQQLTSNQIQISKYNILCNGRRIYTALSEEEYFDVMEDLAVEYYQTGSPLPENIETEIIGELTNGKGKEQSEW